MAQIRTLAPDPLQAALGNLAKKAAAAPNPTPVESSKPSSCASRIAEKEPIRGGAAGRTTLLRRFRESRVLYIIA